MGGDSTVELIINMYLDNPLLSRKPYGYLSADARDTPIVKQMPQVWQRISAAAFSRIPRPKFFLDRGADSG
jgi:hypothetical protein